MATKNLSWKATPNKDWITVTPEQGNGDTNVSINFDNVRRYEPDKNNLSGTVTFSCTNCTKSDNKTIDVCRCSCDCGNLKNISKVYSEYIPEEGLTTGSTGITLLMYSIDSNRCDEKIGEEQIVTAVFKDEKNGHVFNVDCDNGKAVLKENIPANDGPKKHFSLTLYYDKDRGNNNSCYNEEIFLEQAGIDCSCEAAIKNVSYNSVFTPGNSIPQTGLTNGTTLLTYTIKSNCPYDENTLRGKLMCYDDNDSLLYERDINYTNTTATLDGVVEHNDGRERIIKVYTYYGDSEEPCLTGETTQTGCDCETVFVPFTFDVKISTFGAEIGDEIGTYEMNPLQTCPSSKINAKLENNGVIYELKCESNKVFLTGSTAIEENSGKTSIFFTLTVGYGDEGECDSATIEQEGVDCDGIKITLNDDFCTIPKSGIVENTIVGTFINNGREVIIEEKQGRIKLDTTTDPGNIILLETISENGGTAPILYTLIVKYKDETTGRFRKCTEQQITQEGLQCSCESVKLSVPEEMDSWVEYPYAGTNGEWILFATGDTAMYTQENEFVGVCGKLGAQSESDYLKPDDEEDIPNRISPLGSKVRIIAAPLTDEEIETIRNNQGESYTGVSHIYEFWVNILEYIPEETEDAACAIALYFYKWDGTQYTEHQCINRKIGFKQTANACDCTKAPKLNVINIPCDGTDGIIELGYLFKMNMPENMVIDSITLDETFQDNKIENFTANLNGKHLSYDAYVISGSVSERGEKNMRTVGRVIVRNVCNKGLPNEWHCDSVVEISQSNCIVCDCDYINGNKLDDHNIKFSSTADTVTSAMTRIMGLDCGKVEIEGQDESGKYYLERYGTVWGEAWIEKETVQLTSGVVYIYNLVAKITDGSHVSREAQLNILYKYNGQTCSSKRIYLTDIRCDCEMFEEIFGSESTINISPDKTSGTTDFDIENLDCIRFYVLDSEGNKHYVGDPDFTYKSPDDPSKTLFTVHLSTWRDSLHNYRHMFTVSATLNSQVEITNTELNKVRIIVKGELYTSTGYVDCENETKIKVQRAPCTCPYFYRDIATYNYFTQNDTTLHVGNTIKGVCNKGILIVFNGEDGYYSASDLTGTPLEGIILDINGCEPEGTDCCSRSFNLTVKPLEEGETRTYDVAICECDDDGNPKLKANNTCECSTAFTVTHEWVWDCSSIGCDFYTTGLEKIWTTGHEENIYKSSATQDYIEVANYNPLPDGYGICWDFLVICDDSNVLDYTHGDASQYDSTKKAIKVKLKESANVGSPITINVSFLIRTNASGQFTNCKTDNILLRIQN